MSGDPRSDGQALLAVLQQSLGPWAPVAAPVLASSGLRVASLEASARGGDGPVRGGRMMVEQAPRGLCRALWGALALPQRALDTLLDIDTAAPVILGWDTARTPPVAKLYLNLSDCSGALRERAGRAFGAAGAPHVLGVNVARSEGGAAVVDDAAVVDHALERKAYYQRPALAADTPGPLRAWASGVSLAGVVESFDILPGGQTSRRACFVAPRDDRPGAALLASLPGWDAAAFDAAIPFDWAQVRSVGLPEHGRGWVAYVKPRGAGASLRALDPVVCVRRRAGGGSDLDDGPGTSAAGFDELGVFVVQRGGRERAFASTAVHALSYRVRGGAPDGAEIGRVMRWAVAAVRAAEARGHDARDVSAWPAPPEGWHVIRD